MLQIQSITKTYRTGSLVQKALAGVSLSLRESEFVAILGPSGSGKTTLLNVIGGLDRYEGGDLIINGVSTKKYNSRDWDAYRNHTVGFVFQSYNLIPHQTILKNVELALTISGVSRKERTRRAADALAQVGLGEQLHKKPAQLSGGQMQRVAIARALVNDPGILLADEPTGALDSDTSLQVMDLLREVARDRLVVMVTHNPELAQQYATRIVTLKDGAVTSDSHPFTPPPEEQGEPAHRRLGRASMSFFTALSLSFNNLWTKKARTVLVAFAGSIGIIGIAMILSLSRGVDRYIQSVEEETLQNYPLTITDTSYDLTSFMLPQAAGAREPREDDGKIVEARTVTRLFTQAAANDLRSLRHFLEEEDSGVKDYVQAIEYSYNLSPRIYSLRDGKARQVNPDQSFSALGLTGAESMNGLLSSFSSVDLFRALPEDGALYQGQYQVLAGHWPERWDQCVVVLSPTGRVSDRVLYALGLKDPALLDRMVKAFAAGETAPEEAAEGRYDPEDFLGLEFRLVRAADFYTYDSEYQVWADRSADEDFVLDLVRRGAPLTVVGVARPREDNSSPLLTQGIHYAAGLIPHLMESAGASAIVRAQLADPDRDVFSGRPFGEENRDRQLDVQNLFTVDQDALREAFALDPAALPDLSGLDLSGLDLSSLDLSGVDLAGLDLSLPSLSAQDVRELLAGVKIDASAQSLERLFRALLEGYLASAGDDPAADPRQLPAALEAYLASDSARELLAGELAPLLRRAVENTLTPETLRALVEQVLAGYPAYAAENGLDPEDPAAGLATYLASPAARAALEDSAAALREELAAALLTPEEARTVAAALAEGYAAYAAENGLPDPARITETFTQYLSSPAAQALLAQQAGEILDTAGLEDRAAALFARYSAALGDQLSGALAQVMGSVSRSITAALTENMAGLMEQVSQNFLTTFDWDSQSLGEAFRMTMDAQELRDLMTSLLSREETSYEGNLKKLGWADPDSPGAITLYPTDFEGKKAVKEILDGYNRRMEAAGEKEKVIAYTDMVDTLMSSVTDIVNAISYVLIAFVAISLVVSSVMIGVITYISVLERKKEIGILRAIGASRRNISAVFNAETFIIGALAGLMGVGITLLLLIPANHVIHTLAEGVNVSAFLPPEAGVILVLLSIALTLLGGLIPSRKAAHSDPVEALRSE